MKTWVRMVNVRSEPRAIVGGGCRSSHGLRTWLRCWGMDKWKDLIGYSVLRGLDAIEFGGFGRAEGEDQIAIGDPCIRGGDIQLLPCAEISGLLQNKTQVKFAGLTVLAQNGRVGI